jgi:hypothetical protein
LALVIIANTECCTELLKAALEICNAGRLLIRERERYNYTENFSKTIESLLALKFTGYGYLFI